PQLRHRADGYVQRAVQHVAQHHHVPQRLAGEFGGVGGALGVDKYCGQGIGTKVVGIAITNAFHFFREDGFIYKKGSFERLHARVIGHNPAAERVLEKNGFIYEGNLRNAACKDGNNYDQKVYGLVHPLVPPVSSAHEETYSTPTLPDNKSERIEYLHKLLHQEWT
ncbi:MAG: GNAT family N-acetyltransferase, partial [Bacteroidales bacterium]|nr:GNAT family N-acetyltransferase [Bacteroidales bacterium]